MKNCNTFKRLLIPFLLLLCISSYAQHMKFMGIPLNGTISEFTAKMKAKGAIISPGNSVSGPGCRYFNGTFFGEKANFYVYYNPSTKIVYRAKAVITSTYFDYVKNIYDEIKRVIQNKYQEKHREGTFEGYVHVHYDIDLGTKGIFSDGTIALYFGEINLHKNEKGYDLYIDYYDTANRKKHENSINSDI